MTIYKVWVEVEELTDDGDETDSVAPEPLEVGVYDTLEEAEAVQLAIHQAHWEDCNGPECKLIPHDAKDDEPEAEDRPCERCHTVTKCEEIPLMGYSEFLCRSCAAAAHHNGEWV